MMRRLYTQVRRRVNGLPRSARELESTLSLMADLRRWGWHDSIRMRRPQMMGKPVPWLTYPAVVALGRALRGTESVLEIGAGTSTLWFAVRAAEVVSIEGDEAWAAELRSLLPSNVRLLFHSYNDTEGFFDTLAGLRGPFDVVVVDGGPDRSRACGHAAEVLNDDGLIVLDNSHASVYQQGVDQLADRGFCRVDFHGAAPGVRSGECTSFFSQRLERWFPGGGSVSPRPIFETENNVVDRG
jgi:precorrin-6B methylase 2